MRSTHDLSPALGQAAGRLLEAPRNTSNRRSSERDSVAPATRHRNWQLMRQRIDEHLGVRARILPEQIRIIIKTWYWAKPTRRRPGRERGPHMGPPLEGLTKSVLYLRTGAPLPARIRGRDGPKVLRLSASRRCHPVDEARDVHPASDREGHLCREGGRRRRQGSSACTLVARVSKDDRGRVSWQR